MTSPYLPADAERRVCAVCARGLESLTDRVTGKKTFVHSFQMVLDGSDDHLPVPVAPDQIQHDTRCDFCHWRNPEWIIPVRDFEYEGWRRIGIPIAGGSRGSWAACDTCANLVNRGLWSNLTRRAVDSYLHVTREMELDSAMHDTEAAQFAIEHIKLTYRQLRKNILGPPRRLNG